MKKEGQDGVEVRQAIIKESWGGMARKQGKVSAHVWLRVGRGRLRLGRRVRHHQLSELSPGDLEGDQCGTRHDNLRYVRCAKHAAEGMGQD